MRLVTTDKLIELQKNPKNIRNICIMAHVDHGKTTLADSLVASNGIISQRLVGRLRYLDSRKDEQERGITMKSSSIALHYTWADSEYLVNLIDSPGHVDFSSEVSTAVRLCDGAMIVVDVVEGVCAQTIVALRQAWQENIKLVLVLNKIDRLIIEMKLNPLDAYILLTQILEKVNVIMAELLTSEVLGQENQSSAQKETVPLENNQPEYYDWSSKLDDVDDSKVYFSPDQGNVIFASAFDGWGFRVEDFAKLYSQKIGVKTAILNRTLWGDFYLNTKLKRISKGAQEKAKKPMFVQLILENIWSMYDAIAVRKDKIQVEKMVQNLGLSVPPRSINQTDVKGVLQAVMSAWLPLSQATLEMVCRVLPSPMELESRRAERLMFAKAKSFAILPPESQALKEDFIKCDASDSAPVIVFVSKMFAVDPSALPENRPKTLTAEELAARREQAKLRLAERLAQRQQPQNPEDTKNEQIAESAVPDAAIECEPQDSFIAFCRVYSGTLKTNSELYILGPRYDPSIGLNISPDDIVTSLKDLQPGHHVTKAKISQLYILMGRELEAIQSAPAGNIIGIGGLDDHILKTATISSTLLCPPFVDLNLIAVPILRVALEPVHTNDLSKLVHGLKLLNQADPCVQILMQETGEHVLITAGEVHLQRCLDDLRERFAKVAITASPPIVPFRETVIDPPKVDMMNELIDIQHKMGHMTVAKKIPGNESDGTVFQTTQNKKCSFKIRACALPHQVTKLLEDSQDLIKSLTEVEKSIAATGSEINIQNSALSNLRDFNKDLRTAFESDGWDGKTVDKIWAFGPKKCGPNVLINSVSGCSGSVWPVQLNSSLERTQVCSDLQAFESYFVNGFQLATMAGPLCEEPMMGVAFIVSEWNMAKIHNDVQSPDHETEDTVGPSAPFGPFSGQLISSVKDGCRKAFQAQPQRLMVAMYSCSIQVNSEALGKLYAVLGKRGGRIIHGDIQEGSTVFEITALLPVVESFDLANEIRRQTSGLALPQMVFSGWEVLEIDPFWQPTTEEEYLHYGEKADTENRARKYMNAVRKRKGLRVEEKTVEFAEKQRTLTRNK